MIAIAAFLGNPGKQYENNRHNTPWLFLRSLPFFPDLDWKKKFKAEYASVSPGMLNETAGLPGSRDLVFLMPQTFMNLSGQAIGACASFYKVKPEEILVVHDELELPLGWCGFKFGGGLGGHNGLRSAKDSLGTADFWRLRLGIGRPGDRAPGKGGPPGSGVGVYDWVLSDFGPAETPALQAAFAALAAPFCRALTGGPESLLPEWKKRAAAEDI
jgi:PTH1 family peptidyl-tRNA hydrolase